VNIQDLNELDFSNVGQWPIAVKAICVLIVCGACGAFGYYIDTQGELGNLAKIEAKELSLQKVFEEKQRKAANLEPYKLQLEEMQVSFGTMLRQLPNKTEVAELLVDVSQTGLASGLEFELFQPESEVRKEFYAELPIKLKVMGRYHEFGDFISGLAALPRIVTIHNITIGVGKAAKKPGSSAGSNLLLLEATAKTYRYLDEEERE
jgi:type IV pilus assembly protein PilO